MARCSALTTLPSDERRGRNEKLKTALQSLLSDDGFRLSPVGKSALETAQSLATWCDDPQKIETMTSFTSEVFERLKACIPRKRNSKYMEKIWGSFHQERCSVEYRSLWSSFMLSSINCTEVHPIFFQYVTDQLFKMVIRQEFPTEQRDREVRKEALSYEEKNVIRFIGGYVLRALQKKIERSSQPLKKELLLCLMDLLESDFDDYDESSDWVSLKDRGGLNHVSQNMFMLISSMELEVKHHISMNSNPNDFNIKDVLSRKLLSNEEVEHYWEILSVNWGERESKILLSMIVDHWITIRGFSYTSAWMERYKNSTHKKVQKSKGIRKTVMGSGSTSTEDN